MRCEKQPDVNEAVVVYMEDSLTLTANQKIVFSHVTVGHVH